MLGINFNGYKCNVYIVIWLSILIMYCVFIQYLNKKTYLNL